MGHLGSGGFGHVFEVFDKNASQHVAMKISHAPRGWDLYAFKEEFRSLVGLRHTNLVALHEMFVGPGLAAFTMELIRGVSVLDYVAEGRSPPRHRRTARTGAAPLARSTRQCAFSESRLRAALEGIETGLRHLHDAGLVHGDLKPANILVEPETGRVVLLDFGLVSHVRHDAAPGVIGTPGYLAPEREFGPPTPASDWYAVGVLMHECMSGCLPVGGARLDAMLPADLIRRCKALLRHPPEQRPFRDPNPAPFVGRAGPLAQLESLIGDLMTEGGTHVEVRAEAGAGKTRLCEILHARTQKSATWFKSRCQPAEWLGFNAIDGIVDDLTWHVAQNRIPVSRDDLALLSHMWPVVTSLTGTVDREPGVDRPELRRRAISALLRILGTVAARRPLVVLVDDTHWIDDDSVRVLRSIVRAQLPHVLLLTVARPSGRERVTPHLVIDLPPLTSEDARTLAGLLAVDVDRLEMAETSARGNAFMLNEVLREGSDSLSQRLGQLREREFDLLRAVGIAGHPILRVDLASAGFPTDEVCLGALRTARLLAGGNTEGGDRLEPYHARVTEALAQLVPTDVRRSVHERLADAMAKASRPPHQLARHYAASENHSKARAFAELAADEALETLAFDRAVEFYRLANQHVDEPALQEKLADALIDAGRGIEAAHILQQLASRAEGSDSRMRLERRACEQLLRSGAIEEGLGALDHVLERVGLHRDATAIGAVVRSGGQLAALRWAGTSKWTSERQRRLDACWTASMGLGLIDPVRAAPFAFEAQRLSRSSPDPVVRVRSALMHASFLASSGRLELAWDQWAQAAELARELDDPWLQGLLFAIRAIIAYESADWRRVYESSRLAEEMFRGRCRGVAWELRTVQLFSASALIFLGDFNLLRESTLESLREADDRGDRYAAANLRLQLLPPTHLASGNPGRARRELREALGRWPSSPFTLQHNYALGSETIIDLYLARPEAAWRRIHAQQGRQRASLLMLDRSIRTYWLFTRATVILSVARRRPVNRLMLAEARIAAERLARAGQPAYRGWGRILRAAQVGLGDARRSLPDLRLARAEFLAADMALYAAATSLWLADVQDDPAMRREARELFRRRGVMDGDGVGYALLGVHWGRLNTEKTT